MARDMFTRAFTNPVTMDCHTERCQWQAPIYDPEHTRIAVVDGQVVSGVVMGPRSIRFGPVTVPAMTLGPVGTHDQHRKQGYAAVAMNDASDYMARTGVLVAYLQGIPDFYYRFGYYPFTAPGNAKFSREAARRESLPGKLRKMARDDVPKVRRLFERVTSSRVCAAAREDDVWDWLLGPGGHSWFFQNPRVITDDRGRLAGYLTTNLKEGLEVREFVVRQDEASCRVALGALTREAKRREVKEIELRLPWDDAMAVFLRQFVGAHFSMHSNPTGGALMKVVDFPALMRRLEPLFTQRWCDASARLSGGVFTLESEIGAVGVRLTRNQVRITEPVAGAKVRVPQRWLSGLLTGYHAAGDIAPRKGARIPGELLPVMEALFPRGWPFVYQGDNY